MSGSVGGDRNSKRQKAGEGGPMTGPPNGNYPPHPYPQQPPFRQPPYGGPPPPHGGQFPMQPQSGYIWQQQQPPPYGNQPVWSHGQQHPPPQMGMYRQGPPNGMPPDQSGNWNGFRGPPQQPPPQMGGQGHRGAKQNTPPRAGTPAGGAGESGAGGPPGPPNQQGYWGPQQQWPQHQWGNGPPMAPMWQGGPPIQQPGPSPPNIPQHMQGQQMHMGGNQQMWHGGRPAAGMQSPPRPGQPPSRPRSSPEMMGGYPGGAMGGMPDAICKPVMDSAAGPEMEMYMGRGNGQDEPKGRGSNSDKDKGRGSYRCGRCGAPKKGHVCPYQPKLKRRPDEPPPVMRNAAVQVEMDEFMTLRRLNLEIQGFPESYATGPQMSENMVVGEPHPYALGNSGVMSNSMVTESRGELPHPTHHPPHTMVKPAASIENDSLRISPRASPAEAQA